MNLNLDIFAGRTTFDLEDVFQSAKEGDHANAMPFAGIVTLVDTPSNSAPHGSDGHRIMMPKEAAEKRLHTLIGQGINFRDDLSGHAAQRKVGFITDAWMEGNAVKVKGIIWKRDFPDAEKKLKGQRLGMSMELANVDVDDMNADVWQLNDFTFTGATILQNNRAAYHRTALAASKDDPQSTARAAQAAPSLGGSKMATTKKKAADKNVQILASAISDGLGASLKTTLENFGTTIVTAIKASHQELLDTINASDEDPEEEALASLDAILAAKDDDEDDMDAAKKGKKDDDDESSDDDEDDDDADVDAGKKDDDDDDDDMDASLATMSKSGDPDGDGDDPGHLNKNAGSRGNKTSVTKSTLESGKGKGMTKPLVMKSGKGVNAGKVVQAMAAATDEIRTLRASEARNRGQIDTLQAEVGKLKRLVKKMEAQQDRYVERQERKTLPPAASAILQKAGYNFGTLQAEGTKLSVAQVDQILAEAAPNLAPREKATFKNIFLEHGIMDEGYMDRGYGIGGM